MKMPKRKPSSSSLAALIHVPQHHLPSSTENHVTSQVCFSAESPLGGFDNSVQGSTHSSTSFNLVTAVLDLLPPSDFTAAIVEIADEGDDKEVRFATLPTTQIKTVMGISDYTAQEVKDCWYSRVDVECMRRRENKRFRKQLCSQRLNREDTRWAP